MPELMEEERPPVEMPPIGYKTNIYTLDRDVAELEAKIAQAEGEASDELIDAYLNAGGDLKKKLDGYGNLRINKKANAERLRALAAPFAAEAERLIKLAMDDEKTVERLEARLKRYIEGKGCGEIATDHFRFSVVSTGGNQKLQLTKSPDELPPRFRKREVEYKADQQAIRAAIAAGKRLPWASLAPRVTNLVIK